MARGGTDVRQRIHIEFLMVRHPVPETILRHRKYNMAKTCFKCVLDLLGFHFGENGNLWTHRFLVIYWPNFNFPNMVMLYTIRKIISCSFRIKIATVDENAYFRSYKRFRKVYRNRILAFYKGDMLKSIKTNILNLKINDVSFNILAWFFLNE